jgi:hypothetical protein
MSRDYYRDYSRRNYRDYYKDDYYDDYSDDYRGTKREDKSKTSVKVDDKKNKELSDFNILYDEKSDIDSQLLENYNKIIGQIKIWKEKGDEMNAFISEFNDTYVELFKMNHIHLKPYPLNNYSFMIKGPPNQLPPEGREMHKTSGIFTHIVNKNGGQILKILFGVDSNNESIECEYGDGKKYKDKHASDSICIRKKNYSIIKDGKWIKMPEHERIKTFIDSWSIKGAATTIGKTIAPTVLGGDQQYSRYLVDKSTFKKISAGANAAPAAPAAIATAANATAAAPAAPANAAPAAPAAIATATAIATAAANATAIATAAANATRTTTSLHTRITNTRNG